MSNQQPEKRTRDLIAQQFPYDLNWETSERLKSLKCLFEFVDTHCTEAINWYNRSKRNKQRLGYSLRFLSILAVAIAGIIPVVSEIICREERIQCISPAWATVFVALAALFVALDRFAGYTSGWVRYVRSAQKLAELQGQFRLDWCMYLHSEAVDIDSSVSNGNAQKAKDHGLLLCKEYIASVNSVVSRETDAWAQEFQQVLVQFEKPETQGQGTPKLDGVISNGLEG